MLAKAYMCIEERAQQWCLSAIQRNDGCTLVCINCWEPTVLLNITNCMEKVHPTCKELVEAIKYTGMQLGAPPALINEILTGLPTNDNQPRARGQDQSQAHP